jgi:aspartate dehydrogenase
MPKVNIIGAGRIAAPVIEFIESQASWTLDHVLANAQKSIGNTTTISDRDAFFACPADIIIEAAGPNALREHGLRAVAQAHLWTVGASALICDSFRSELEAVARKNNHCLRLFANGVAGTGEADNSADGLHYRGISTKLGEKVGTVYSGPLRQAVELFPDQLNSAVAAALAGPGIERTTVELVNSGPGGKHSISAVYATKTGTMTREILFAAAQQDITIHPVSNAIITALVRREGVFRFS